MSTEELKPFDPVAHLNACFELPNRRVARGESLKFAEPLHLKERQELLDANLEANGGYEWLARSQTIQQTFGESEYHEFKMKVVKAIHRCKRALSDREIAEQQALYS